MTDTLLADHQPSTETVAAPVISAGAPATFKNVLVGIDGTSAGRDAIALGERLCDADGHLTLAELTGTFAPAVSSGLHRLARDAGADLLVVGSSARGPIARLLHGDNTRSTLTGAPCAVAVAPRGYARRPKPIGTIGVAYDGSPQSEIAVLAARVLAARHGAALHAATAVWPTSVMAPPASRLPLFGAWWGMMLDAYEQEASERLRALTGTEGTVLVGPPEDELLAFSERVDLLVVGSRGHGRLRRLLLGSTSAALARRARCPLLVLPRDRTAAHAT